MNPKFGLLMLWALIPAIAPAGEPHLPPIHPVTQNSEGGWRISAGYVYRDLGGVRFESGSYSQGVRLPSMVGSPFRRPGRAGASSGAGARFYDHGFVRPDSSGSVDGLTWFWGYESASQSAGDSIVFRDRSARERKVWRSSEQRASAWGDDLQEGGPLLHLEYQFPLAESLKAGFGVGVSMIEWGGMNQATTFRAAQLGVERQTVVTDAFGLGGAIAPLPPYSGSFEGPGVLLDAAPVSRSTATREVERVRYDFFNRVAEQLELDLYTISPGFSVELDRGAWFASVGAGLAVNVVDWEASYEESLYVSRDRGRVKAVESWSERAGGTDVVFGAYVQAAVGVELTERVSVQGFARYDWSEEFSGRVGPSQFAVDLEGVSGGVMVSFEF